MDIAKRHYLRRVPLPFRIGDSQVSTPVSPPIPREWTSWLDPQKATYLHDPQGLIQTIQAGHSHEVTRSRREELLTLLMVELLFRHYRGIRRELALR